MIKNLLRFSLLFISNESLKCINKNNKKRLMITFIYSSESESCSEHENIKVASADMRKFRGKFCSFRLSLHNMKGAQNKINARNFFLKIILINKIL